MTVLNVDVLSLAIQTQEVLTKEAVVSRSLFKKLILMDNFNATQTPVSIQQSESEQECATICARDDVCITVIHHGSQCSMYRSPPSISSVSVPGARSFIKRVPCPESQGYKSAPSAGLCFKYHAVRMSWTASQEQCEIEGGRLIILNTVEKLDHVIASIVHWSVPPHIGLQKKSGRVRWTDGSTYLPGTPRTIINGCGQLGGSNMARATMTPATLSAPKNTHKETRPTTFPPFQVPAITTIKVIFCDTAK
ncbi:uncharacterized protein [Haliotis asinina]|uniref:uncharacterized protein n=1 Tax=Haliotis asinina TaxID=109174 RepID=UPI003531E371